MPAHDRDVAAFDRRADRYESGWRGRWHEQIVQRSVDVALAAAPVALRVLDIGCGSGALVREFDIRLPTAIEIVGIDPAPGMLAAARAGQPGRARFARAFAEQLPFADAHFDLVVSTLSFDHWADPVQGLREAQRVLAPAGVFVLVDLCSMLLRRGERARTPKRLRAALESTGLTVDSRETVYRLAGFPLVQAFLSSR